LLQATQRRWIIQLIESVEGGACTVDFDASPRRLTIVALIPPTDEYRGIRRQRSSQLGDL